MLVQHEDDKKKGSFFIEQDGKRLGEMTYVWSGEGLFIIDHTEVDPALEGKGAGKQLLHHAVEFARANQYKIIPLCPFAKAVIQKTPGYQDILK